jgi:hypothetical protein
VVLEDLVEGVSVVVVAVAGNMITTRLYLSKSDFLKYQICPGYLWLWKNKREVVPEDNPEDIEHRIEQGNEVEGYARQLFPGGVLLEGKPGQTKKKTEKAMLSEIKTLFQATVITDKGMLAKADILERNDDGWNLYEVKSTTEIKDEHLIDATFQKVAFINAGYNIRNIYIVYLNKEYIRHGRIWPNDLFKIENVDNKVNKLYQNVESAALDAITYINKTNEPKTCSCLQKTKSKHCPTFSYFHPDIPEYSVYNLGRATDKTISPLVDMEIFHIHDIPDDYKLSEKQRNQVTVAKLGQPLIHPELIKSELDSLCFPQYYLDYETISTAIPMFEGCKPYQQIPFQYSLHILREPRGKLEHFEYLARFGKENPVPALLSQMKNEIGDTGSVIVWYKPFETSRNKEMALMYPDYADFLNRINARVYDLMDIFAKQYHVHPLFLGKTSIKYVLPVLVPELSYKELDIQNGGIACLRWLQMVTGVVSKEKADKIYKDLLKYCELDTLAMYKIYEYLLSLI